MAERLFEEVRVSTGDVPGTLPSRFAEMHADGWRLEALTMAGTLPRGCWVAATWVRDGDAPEQRLGRIAGLDDAKAEAQAMDGEGFGAALIAATYDEDQREAFLLVYEKVSGPNTILWDHHVFAEFRGAAAAEQHSQYLRSAVVLDPGAGTAREPRFVGTLWSYDGEAFDWGVTYWYATALEAPFIDHSPRASAMAVAGRPWVVVPSYSRSPRAPTGRPEVDSLRRLLAIWRDRFYTLWPGPGIAPLDPAYRRELEITIDVVGANLVDARVAEREAKNYKLVSWAVRGSSKQDAVYALNWVPRSWELQTRSFIMTGPGNLRNGIDAHGVTHVGPEARALGESTGAGRWGEVGARGFTAADPKRRAPRLLHPFDRVMWKWMVEHGARAAQLAVNRKGELRFSRAYTWAEDGYPVTKTYHRMRIGSVSKTLTALVLLRHYLTLQASSPSDLGLDRWFGGELDIHRAESAFNQITIRQALAHTSRIDQDQIDYGKILDVVRPDDVPEQDDDLEPLGPSAPRPGDMREAFERWSVPLVTLPPGTEAYNNYTYIALAELWSRLHLGTSWQLYDTAIVDALLRRASVELASATSGATLEQCEARFEVPYHPHFLGIARPDATTPENWLLSPYTFDTAFSGGSGGLSLSMRELGRVLALLTRRGDVAPLFDEPEKWLMAGRPDASVVDPPLGWNTSALSNLSSPPWGGLDDDMVWLVKYGAVEGCLTTAVHWFPGPTSSFDETYTVDIAASFNCNFPELSPFADLRLAAKEVEEADLWAPVDLTNGTLFDEEAS